MIDVAMYLAILGLLVFIALLDVAAFYTIRDLIRDYENRRSQDNTKAD